MSGQQSEKATLVTPIVPNVLEIRIFRRPPVMARWEALQAHAAASQEREAEKDGQQDWDDFFDQRGGISSGSFDDEQASLNKHIEHVCSPCNAVAAVHWHCHLVNLSEQQRIPASRKARLE